MIENTSSYLTTSLRVSKKVFVRNKVIMMVKTFLLFEKMAMALALRFFYSISSYLFVISQNDIKVKCDDLNTFLRLLVS